MYVKGIEAKSSPIYSLTAYVLKLDSKTPQGLALKHKYPVFSMIYKRDWWLLFLGDLLCDSLRIGLFGV